MKARAVVLLSGGLDSAVTAAIARDDGDEIYGLTVAYGQRHAIEVSRARVLAEWLGLIRHVVLPLDLSVFGGSALTGDGEVPKDREAAERRSSIPVTYVPARNTIFLALGAAYAEAVGAGRLYIGANVVDYSGYPDCRPEFLEAFERVAALGTRAGVSGHGLKICAPLLALSKAEIIRRGAELQVPLHLTHSCYDPGPDGVACGRCDSCVIRLEGFRAAGMRDAIRYADIHEPQPQL
jgi:7-cyano-7-deazaguanine synthase